MSAPRDHTRKPLGNGNTAVWVALGVLVFTLLMGLFFGGHLASIVTGHGRARGTFLAGISTVFHPTTPGQAWATAMPGPIAYWLITGPVTLLFVTGLIFGYSRWLHYRTREHGPLTKLHLRPGMATAHDVEKTMGSKALMVRAPSLRPQIAAHRKPQPADVGWNWGTMHKVGIWTSVRDAVVVVGPSGSGKTVYVVIPRILDAPGALIVTSIRPDVLTPTLRARSRIGPVVVIAPDGSLDALPESTGWSFIYGCESGRTAIERAATLVSGTSTGVENASYWEEQSKSCVQSLLHAAALGGKNVHEFWRWTMLPDAATEAVRILEENPLAEPGWAESLRVVIQDDPKLRGNIWSGVKIAFACLSSAHIRSKFDIHPDQQLNLVDFIRNSGTLYLIASESEPASRILQCLVSEMVRAGKMIADMSPGLRCDPPMALVLDEIANWSPLPQLTSYVSGYGGSGIVTMPIIQSVAQMEEGWGREAAAAIWGAATIKIVLGGLTNEDTLQALATLSGERDEETWSTSQSRDGNNLSSQIRSKPVLNSGEIRGMAEGTALMLFKGNPPALLTMTAYYRRSEAARLNADSTDLLAIIAQGASERLAYAFGGHRAEESASAVKLGKVQELELQAVTALDTGVNYLEVPPAALELEAMPTAPQKDSDAELEFLPLSFNSIPAVFDTTPTAEATPAVTPVAPPCRAMRGLGASDGQGSWSSLS